MQVSTWIFYTKLSCQRPHSRTKMLYSPESAKGQLELKPSKASLQVGHVSLLHPQVIIEEPLNTINQSSTHAMVLCSLSYCSTKHPNKTLRHSCTMCMLICIWPSILAGIESNNMHYYYILESEWHRPYFGSVS